MPTQFPSNLNGLSTTNQDEQHQEFHCRGGEGVQALSLSFLSRCRGIDTLLPHPLHIHRLIMIPSSACNAIRSALCQTYQGRHVRR